MLGVLSLLGAIYAFMNKNFLTAIESNLENSWMSGSMLYRKKYQTSTKHAIDESEGAETRIRVSLG